MKIQRLQDTLLGLLVGVVFWRWMFDSGMTMSLLYGLMTGLSVLFGTSFLRSRSSVAEWERKEVPAPVRVKWAKLLGVLFLIVAAVCPVGFLVRTFVEFDQDFLLYAQIIGFLLAAVMSIIPLKQKG